MDRVVVIGLGSGRCGTRSLSMFLEKHGIICGHERYLLNLNPQKEPRLRSILRRLKHDVGYYWLNYVGMVLDSNPNTKFICFWREKERVIASFMRHTLDPIYQALVKSQDVTVIKSQFRYCDTVTQKQLDEMDPATREFVESAWTDWQYNEDYEFGENYNPDAVSSDRRTYLSNYYDDYYVKAESLQAKYPDNFKIFDMLHALNTIDGNNEILNFIGVTPNTMAQ